jgi:hypothetical protein
MKTKDLIYISIIAGLGYLCFFKLKNKITSINTIDKSTSNIQNVEANNPELPDLFSGRDVNIEVLERTTPAELQDKPLSFFIIPATDYSRIYSKVDGRFFYQEKGILVKSIKVEIPEIEYLKAYDFYTKKVLPYNK